MAEPMQIQPGQVLDASKYSKDDVYIAVMGVTGAGKTTFISTCCQEAGAGVGHGLKSETKNIRLYTTQLFDKRIHLIDTPGFDDTYRADVDVLRDLAYWLTASFKEGFRLTGMVYLHPVTANRLNGAAFKNLKAFQKLCGRESMDSIVLATTMWSRVQFDEGDMRETELKQTEDFWGQMIVDGSIPLRYGGDQNSAMNIIAHLLSKNRPTTLKLQREMAIENKTLDDTEAGREVDGNMIRQRQMFERQLADSVEEMQAAMRSRDQQRIEEAAEAQRITEAKIREIERGREELRTSMERLIKNKEAAHEHAMRALREQLQSQTTQYEKNQREFQDLKNATAMRERENERWREEMRQNLRDANARSQAAKDDADNMSVYSSRFSEVQPSQTRSDTSNHYNDSDTALLVGGGLGAAGAAGIMAAGLLCSMM